MQGLWWKIVFRAIQLLEGVGWIPKPPKDSQNPSLSCQVSLASLYSDNIRLLIKSRQNFVISYNSLLNFRLLFSMNAILPDDTLQRDTGEAQGSDDSEHQRWKEAFQSVQKQC